MRAPAYAIAALAALLLCSIALFGHKPTHTLAELEARCEDTSPAHTRARIRSCRAILRRYVFAPWYRGAINSQLCVAFAKAERWQKAVAACTLGNDPYPQYANYRNRALAYVSLGETQKAETDLIEAALIKPLAQKELPASK